MAAGRTHVLRCDGGVSSTILGRRHDITAFGNGLAEFDGEQTWALALYTADGDASYDDMVEAAWHTTEYIQAAGSATAMTIQVRRPGGSESDVESVRCVIGRAHLVESPIDVPIVICGYTELVGQFEVFGADEAAELFFSYYRTGDIPPGYVLRAVQGWSADQTSVDLTDAEVPEDPDTVEVQSPTEPSETAGRDEDCPTLVLDCCPTTVFPAPAVRDVHSKYWYQYA